MVEEKKVEDEINDFFDDVSKFKSFTIKYNNTEPNRKVHEAFIEYAWNETDGSYLMAIKKLLENYSLDARIEMLYEKVLMLESKLLELEDKKDDDKISEKNGGVTF